MYEKEVCLVCIASITIEPDKRGGKPCIRRMRITVYDVLSWLAAGMSTAEIIDDFPELAEADIMACLEFAADREHQRYRRGLLQSTKFWDYLFYIRPS